MRDLVVAGGGPVGLATALYAARAGLDVVVREPRTGVVDKACGEGLMPGAVAALADLGVEPVGHPLAGIRYVQGALVAEAPFSGAAGRGVRRTTLHAAMLAAVEQAGVGIEPRAVGSVVQTSDRVLVDGEPSRYLVAADGLHSPVRRLVGLDLPAAGRRRYGLRCHVALAPWSRFVEVHWSGAGEAYVTPVAPDQVGVAVLSAERRPFEELLGTFPGLSGRLAALPRGRVRGAGPLRQRSSRRVSGRVLLVGDAAGYVDALTGEGVSLGIAQAREAVTALSGDRPGDYEARWRRLGRRHAVLTHALLAVSRPPVLRHRIVPAAARFPAVFTAAVNELARPA